MKDQEVSVDVLNRIKIMQAYKDKYGEEEINESFKIYGTWRGIEDYLNDLACAKEANASNK